MRTFFAIALSEAHLNQFKSYLDLLRTALEKQFKAKFFHWVRPENLHVTLQFLAAVKEEDLSLLLAEVAATLSQQSSFYLNFGSLEWFPSESQPRVLSLQVGPEQLLGSLSQLIGQGIKACAYETESRVFRGHLTLGRVNGLHHLANDSLKDLALPSIPPLFVNEIVLFRSEPERGKALYTRLAAIELTKG